MIRRLGILAGAALSLSVSAAQADKLSLNELSAYLNGLKTAQATFSQRNDDGSVSTGNLYIHRPGRMRFEYDPPNSAVVIAGGNTVRIHDPRSNQPPESYPLRRTPLSVVLARKVNLAQAGMVTGHGYDGSKTIVRARDPEHPEYGSIDLKFTDNPVRLDSWTVNNADGSSTTVVLQDMQTGMPLGASLFSMQGGGGKSSSGSDR